MEGNLVQGLPATSHTANISSEWLDHDGRDGVVVRASAL